MIHDMKSSELGELPDGSIVLLVFDDGDELVEWHDWGEVDG